jgi:hypothetical protein
MSIKKITTIIAANITDIIASSRITISLVYLTQSKLLLHNIEL